MEYFDKRPKNVHESYTELVSTSVVEGTDGLLMTLRFAAPVTEERMQEYKANRDSAVHSAVRRMYRECGWTDENDLSKGDFSFVITPTSDAHVWNVFATRGKHTMQ